MADFDTIAAVDLGSNSFHLLVARVVDGELQIIDRLRERVALASGLDHKKRLDKKTRQRALDTLRVFGQRLQHMPPGSVRAVGTNTLRQAKNSRAFLEQAELVLGHPIDVISGKEEARLIYLGVAHTHHEAEGTRRLVVDIGGGSTECIIGEGMETLETDSLYMGCVNFQRFFPEGQITKKSWESAQTAAALELEPIAQRYAHLGWDKVYGASGTISAADAIIRAHGWETREITPKSLKRLKKAILAAGNTDDLKLEGMAPDRATVLASGVAILAAVFDRLGIERMQPSDGALREGLVYDLLGRFQHRDSRDETIKTLSERHQVDVDQAKRVELTALQLLDGVTNEWDLIGTRPRQVLGWAARLHEIGKSIAFSGHHRHGAYIVKHTHMAGFSRDEQSILAEIIGAHRRRFKPGRFDGLPVDSVERVRRLCLLLRLSVVLNRGRARRSVPAVRFTVRKRSMQLELPKGWLDENPLSLADLNQEAELLEKAGYQLSLGIRAAGSGI